MDKRTPLTKPRLRWVDYLRLSLRNLWRNPQRSLLSLSSIVVGTAVVIFLGAVNDGWMSQLRDNFIHTFPSHIQIHAKGHLDSDKVSDFIRNVPEVINAIEAQPAIAAWSPRLEAAGLASVAGANIGVRIIGLLPPREANVSRLRHRVSSGRCFGNGEERRVVLGHDIAQTLGLEPEDKLVLTTQTPEGELRSDLFTLCGTIRSGAPQIDRLFAIIPIYAMHEWLDMPGGTTHIAIRLRDGTDTQAEVEKLRRTLAPENPQQQALEIVSWDQVDPMVSQWVRFSEAYGFIILGIVITLTLAQVSNTMVMSVHDRLREFGLMGALGTRRAQMYALIFVESFLLVASGGLLGYLLGIILVGLTTGGIDFTALAGAFEFFFMQPVIQPLLTHSFALKVVAALSLAALLGGLYPAWMASRLDPVEAMR